MQITPAILTSEISLFQDLVKSLDFSESLDIDIIRPPFVENLTVQFEDVKDILDYNKSIGFHLMVDSPEKDLIDMFNAGLDSKFLRIYLHQESDLGFLKDFDWPVNWQKGIAVKLESDLKSIDFYNQFNELQLMSIETGKQGNPFNKDIVNRVNRLKELGFTKKISLDGGINLETIEIVKNLPIDRISVGSYFQKSQNPKESFRILKDALEK